MMKRMPTVFAATLAGALALGSFPVKVEAQEPGQHQDFDHDHEFRGFVPGSIVLSGTVYTGKCRHRYSRRNITARLSEHRPGNQS